MFSVSLWLVLVKVLKGSVPGSNSQSGAANQCGGTRTVRAVAHPAAKRAPPRSNVSSPGLARARRPGAEQGGPRAPGPARRRIECSLVRRPLRAVGSLVPEDRHYGCSRGALQGRLTGAKLRTRPARRLRDRGAFNGGPFNAHATLRRLATWSWLWERGPFLAPPSPPSSPAPKAVLEGVSLSLSSLSLWLSLPVLMCAGVCSLLWLSLSVVCWLRGAPLGISGFAVSLEKVSTLPGLSRFAGRQGRHVRIHPSGWIAASQESQSGPAEESCSAPRRGRQLRGGRQQARAVEDSVTRLARRRPPPGGS